MISISEFRTELMERLQAKSPLYTFIDRDDFSFVDLGFNGHDGDVAAFRIIITKLPPLFNEEEKTADKIEQYINEL